VLFCYLLLFISIPVTGRRGPHVFETPRIPHFVESGLTDGGEVVFLTRPLFSMVFEAQQLAVGLSIAGA
jgi:hypothetical protein